MNSSEPNVNVDIHTVEGFGDEWSRFTQDQLDAAMLEQIFSDYFSLFNWAELPSDPVGADIGCGSGRWAQVVAPRVHHLMLIDASPEALSVAKTNLSDVTNVSFLHASVGMLPIDDASLDFAYSLGVLHHVPDTKAAISAVAAKLKPGAPFLVYLYYAFDNRSLTYRALWRITDGIRRVVSRLPHTPRYWVSQVIALFVYWPLARLARLMEKIGKLPRDWPLAYYRDKPFYVLRTDSLDRFGTRLEQRFSKGEIRKMLQEAGFANIRFSDRAPFWCAIGTKNSP